ncbi:hypothetical protein IJ847_03065 [Candidatus Saccharibacteria bacterium]|nr:hypothetical protein [Candidatus Saccharibacteria bacterium]
MNNYRDKGAFWLTCNAHKVALELSGGNPVAAVAITVLLERINGARVYQRMKMDLSPEEWDKLYHLCDEDPDKLHSNVVAINEIYSRWNNAGVIHKNLGFASPVLFTEEIYLEDPEREIRDWTKRKLFREHIVDAFMVRYSCAKVSK